MMSSDDPNRRFLALCKLYGQETQKFMEATTNFIEFQKKSVLERNSLLLNSAALLIHTEKVAKCSELSVKAQKLESELAIIKKKNELSLKKTKIFSDLTNIRLKSKPGGSKNDEFQGEFQSKGKNEEAVRFKIRPKKEDDSNADFKWLIYPAKSSDQSPEDPRLFFERYLDKFCF